MKTTPNNKDPQKFVDGITDEQRRADAQILIKIFEEVTGEPPRMWGDSIIGFGAYDYRYASGRTGTWMKTGFSPRKQATTLYIMSGFESIQQLLDQLGPHKTAKSCLYVKRLDQIDLDVLRKLIGDSLTALPGNVG